MQKQSFIRGTVLLTSAALITRLLGFLNGIVLARLLGAEGIGLMMMAYPLIPLIITITQLGLPVAISKLVAEADVRDDQAKVKKILYVSLGVTGTLSVILTTAAYMGAETWGKLFLTDERAYYAMLALIPIAPVVAVSAVLKGYFRGKQNMRSIAFSDIIENAVQVTVVMLLIQLLLPYGLEYAAAGAMIGSVAGEAAGLLYLLLKFRMYRTSERTKRRFVSHLRQGKQTFLELMHIGLPTTGNGFIHSIYSAFQPMLVTKSLAVYGVATAVATKQFGMLAGYAFPLLFFPSFITHSLTTALIPAISEARANRNGRLIHQRIDLAMQISLMVGTPCTVILFMLATPLTTLIYNSPEAGPLLKLLAPIFFLNYFDDPLYAVLLGLGKAKAAMWNFIIATAAKAAAIIILGTEFGIYGVAVGIGFGIGLLAMLHFFSVSSVIGLYLDIKQMVKVAFSGGCMWLIGHYTYAYMQSSGFALVWCVLGTVSVALIVYFIALVATNTIKRSQMKHMLAQR